MEDIQTPSLAEQTFTLPILATAAATATAKSTSFCLERKYLTEICNNKDEILRCELSTNSKAEAHVHWISINQVGKPLDNSPETCFTAIQKILSAFHISENSELLFLIKNSNSTNKMYLGLRCTDDSKAKYVVENMKNYIKGMWPGVSCKKEEGIPSLLKEEKGITPEVVAFTGIPSMASQYENIYPATIDKLMAGMRSAKEYSYLVFAKPIPEQDIDDILFDCREMQGQAESLKSIDLSKSLTLNFQKSISTANTTSVSSKDFKGVAEKVWNSEAVKKIRESKVVNKVSQEIANNRIVGLAAAAGACSAVGACATAVAAAPIATAGIGLGAAGLALGLVPQKTESSTKTDQDSFSVGGSEQISRHIVNKHIEAVGDYLGEHAKRLETGKAIGMWNVGAYLISTDEKTVTSGAQQLKAILSGDVSKYEPIRFHDITKKMEVKDEGKKTLYSKTLEAFEQPLSKIQMGNGKEFEHPLGEHYKALTTVLSTKELSCYINFPLRSVPGISVVDSTPDFALDIQERANGTSTSFGKLLYGGAETEMEYSIPHNLLSRHMLIAGINGSGKTNTVKAIVNGMQKAKDRVPFLIIEPAKTEYVDWAIEYNKKNPGNPIRIFMPGCKDYKQTGYPKEILKINPFEPIWLDENADPNILSHIDRLKSTFASAFPMYDILPVLMEELIYTVYRGASSNWLDSAPIYKRTNAPTLTYMALCVDKVLAKRKYDDQVATNLKACLHTRIDSLRRGWRGEMLCNLRGNTSLEDLFESPCVINLSYVGDDVDKGFIMSLLLQLLYEYRMTEANSRKIDCYSNDCRHLTIIEEAHRVMAKCENPELPQYKTAMMFSNILSEIRAYGEGMVLVDQVPTRLIPDAIKNTNLKIVHRLVAEDDCRAMAESMGLSEEQRMIIPKLLTGQCIVSSSVSAGSYWVKADFVN